MIACDVLNFSSTSSWSENLINRVISVKFDNTFLGDTNDPIHDVESGESADSGLPFLPDKTPESN